MSLDTSMIKAFAVAGALQEGDTTRLLSSATQEGGLVANSAPGSSAGAARQTHPPLREDDVDLPKKQQSYRGVTWDKVKQVRSRRFIH
jgi:hypothetical protein